MLLVVTDDTGLDMVGCYGSPDAAPTPNIDALAAGGCRFDAAFANPYCSPTRAQLLTGRHGHRTGIGSNVPHASAYGLPTQELALPTALAPHGYSTGAFGKWHLLSLPAQGPLHPNLMGFETFAGSAGLGLDSAGPKRPFRARTVRPLRRTFSCMSFGFHGTLVSSAVSKPIR